MLYGLFDGYDYTDSIMEIAKSMDWNSHEYRLIDAVCHEVKQYPEGVTAV